MCLILFHITCEFNNEIISFILFFVFEFSRGSAAEISYATARARVCAGSSSKIFNNWVFRTKLHPPENRSIFIISKVAVVELGSTHPITTKRAKVIDRSCRVEKVYTGFSNI